MLKYLSRYKDDKSDVIAEALDKAIKALEQESKAGQMVKRKCKHPKFDVIVCCQGQPFHYYHSTLIGALAEYGYQYLAKRKYGTMNFSLKQVFDRYKSESEECVRCR